MSPDLNAMVQPFADEELRTYDKTWKDKQGQQRSMTFTFIEDETVMDRLDLGFGRGNWSIDTDPVSGYEGVVKVTLSVRLGADDFWVAYSDFGYPNREGGESLKEAVSDGIRRCGRYLGIARDLYRKDSGPQPRPAMKVVQTVHGDTGAATIINPPRSSTVVPEPPLNWDVLSNKKPEPFGTVAALERDADGAMTAKELFDRADSASVPMDALAQASKKLYGAKAWKVKELTDVQRYTVAIEVGLA